MKLDEGLLAGPCAPLGAHLARAIGQAPRRPDSINQSLCGGFHVPILNYLEAPATEPLPEGGILASCIMRVLSDSMSSAAIT